MPTLIPVAMTKTLHALFSRQNSAKNAASGPATWAAAALVVASLAGCSGIPGLGSTPASAHSASGGAARQPGQQTWSADMRTQLAAFERASEGTGTVVRQTSDQQIQLEIPNDISFDVNRSAVKPALAGLLTRYAAIAKAHPDSMITIVGHTDSSGSAPANNALSRERAQSTRDYLIARGVAITRLQTQGRGSSEPIADNSTPEGRAMNRRVTLYIGQPGSRSAGT